MSFNAILGGKIATALVNSTLSFVLAFGISPFAQYDVLANSSPSGGDAFQIQDEGPVQRQVVYNHPTTSLSFEFNGGEGSIDAVKDIDASNSTIIAPDEDSSRWNVSRKGYRLIGWSSTPGNADEKDDPNTSDIDESRSNMFVPSGISLENLSYSYIELADGENPPAGFDALSISAGDDAKKIFIVDDEKLLPEGYVDNHPMKKSELSNCATADGRTILYAVWQPNSYTIDFNAAGAVGSMEPLKAHVDEEIILPDCSFENEGYSFEGWILASNEEQKVFANKAKVKNLSYDADATVVLGAQWKQNEETEQRPIEVAETSDSGSTLTSDLNLASYSAENTLESARSVVPLLSENEFASLVSTETDSATARNALVTLMSVEDEPASLSHEIEGYSRTGDGSTIESIDVKWITEDTEGHDNGQPELLYILPDDDTPQSVRLQLNYSLSGEHDYPAGSIVITVPAYIFKKYDNAKTGTMQLPYPEEPISTRDFNWKKVGNTYVLTNAKTIPASSKGFMQFAYEDLTPHLLVDMAQSDPFEAKIEVRTHAGNVLALGSNAIAAQFDTQAEVNNVIKYRFNNVRTVGESEVPASQRTGDTEYVMVEWYAYAYHVANTRFTMSMVDTLGDDPAYKGFIGKEGGTKDTRSIDDTYITSYRDNGRDGYVTVRSFYPLSSFTPGNTYTFRNDITYTVTENDPALGEGAKTTTASASATAQWYYRTPKFEEPDGHFMLNKQGNDYTANSYMTHSYSDSNTYWDIHHHNTDDGYGIYPSALNELIKGNDVEISYTLESIGYILPWTYVSDTNPEQPESARKLSNYNQRPVTMVTYDTDEDGASPSRLELDDGSYLVQGTDFDYAAVEFPVVPQIGYADKINLDDSGQFTSANDGQITYKSDSDITHIPLITLEAKVNGTWQKVADIDWTHSRNYPTVMYASGTVSADRRVELPEGTQQVRSTVTSQDNAYIYYYMRPVIKLHHDCPLAAKASALLANSNSTEINVINTGSMRAYQQTSSGRSEIIAFHKTGMDKVRGYSTDVWCYPEKKVSQTLSDVDYRNRQVTLHYTGTFDERTVIPDQHAYEQAVADGEVVPETAGVFYDLLPIGMIPLVDTVRLRDGDVATDVYTIENYKNTHRTLLVVEAQLTPKAVPWTQGGFRYYKDSPMITFDAVYPFSEYTLYGSYTHNVIAFESLSKDDIGTIAGYSGENDSPIPGTGNVATSLAFVAGSGRSAEMAAMTDLDPSRGDNHAFVYAGVSKTVDILAAGQTRLNKDVSVNRDGYWSKGTYGDDRIVYTGGDYDYRLSFTSAPRTVSKDLRLFDSLENFVPGDGNDPDDVDAPAWKGTFTGVDTSQLESRGCAPVVYYSTIADLQLTDESSASGAHDTNTALPGASGKNSVWTRSDVFLSEGGSLSDVKAVAIDASKNASGGDFLLQPLVSLGVTINMKAPSGTVAEGYIAQDAHAYNNAYLKATTYDQEFPTQQETDKFTRNDYTKVGLQNYSIEVEKKWDDDNNRDGLRPAGDGFALTVKLKDGNGDYIIDEATGQPMSVQLSASDDPALNWKASFDNIPYTDATGDKIHYTVEEVNVPAGYAPSVRTEEGKITLTNVHRPATLNISGEKTWSGDAGVDARPSSIKIILYADGEEVDRQAVSVDASGKWLYSFEGVYANANGVPIQYTVGEYLGTSAPYYPVYASNGRDIENVYHPYGDLSITKRCEGLTAANESRQFSFHLDFQNSDQTSIPDEFDYDVVDTDDENAVVKRTGKASSGSVIQLGNNEKAIIKELPEKIRYTVTEELDDGFKLSYSKSTTGRIAANQEMQAEFDNVYKTGGEVSLSAEKELTGRELERYQFRFEVYDVSDYVGDPDKMATEGSLVRLATNREVAEGEDYGEVPFGTIRYSNADDYTARQNKDFVYRIQETDRGALGYTYSDKVYYATVRVTDNGDGTMDVRTPGEAENGSIRYTDSNGTVLAEGALPHFKNEYHASGDADLKAWKQLDGRALQDEEFTFELIEVDEDGNVISTFPKQTKRNGQGAGVEISEIVWDPIHFTEADAGSTHYYVAREVAGSDSSVVYDSSAKGYTVTVVDNGDGTLTCSTGMVNVTATDSEDYVGTLWNEAPDALKDDLSSIWAGVDCTDADIAVYAPGYPAVWQAPPFSSIVLADLVYPDTAYIECYDDNGIVRYVDLCDYDVTEFYTSLIAQHPERFIRFQSDEVILPALHDVDERNRLQDFWDSYVREYGYTTGAYAPAPGYLRYTVETPDQVLYPYDNIYLYYTEYKSYTISATDAELPVFTNTLKPGSLEIQKYVTGDSSGYPQDQTFKFRIEIENEDGLPIDVEEGNLSISELSQVVDPDEAGFLPSTLLLNALQTAFTIDVAWADEGDIASGVYDGVDWRITAAHELIIGKNGEKQIFQSKHTNSYGNDFPWKTQSSQITTISFTGIVVASTHMKGMFYQQSQATSIDIRNFDLSYLQDGARMFGNCSQLRGIVGMENCEMPSLYDAGSMFANCSQIETLNLGNVKARGIGSLNSMFYGCAKLYNLDISGLSFAEGSYGLNLSSLFENCGKLETIDISRLHVDERAGSTKRMFYNCSSLETIYFNNANLHTSSISNPDTTDMFYGCVELEGGLGTSYDPNYVTGERACVDGYNGQDGYFTLSTETRPIAVFVPTTNTLTLYSGSDSPNYHPVSDEIVYSDWCDYAWTLGAPWYQQAANLRFVEIADTLTPENMTCWFYRLSALEEIRHLERIDTSECTNMDLLFYHCSSLTSLDLSHFNTEKVTTMRSMFNGASKLTSLDCSSFDMSRLSNLDSWCYGCSNLSTVVFNRNLDTTSVNNMADMFDQCNRLQTLDMSMFDTQNVTTMEYMFYSCSALQTLDISMFDTSKVTTMESMFSSCSQLQSINVSMFNTENVTTFASMFEGCTTLSVLDVSNFDISKAQTLDKMFARCSSLSNLTTGEWDFGEAKNISSICYYCGFTTIDVSGWHNFNKLQKANSAFGLCPQLKTFTWPEAATPALEEFKNVFYMDMKLECVDLTHMTTPSLKSIDSLFDTASHLQTVSLWTTSTPVLETASRAFSSCQTIKHVDCSCLDTRLATNLTNMFSSTIALRSITLGENFRFSGNNLGSSSSAILLKPPTATTSGKWIKDDGSTDAYEPAEMRTLYDSNPSAYAGTWIWDRSAYHYTITFDANSDAATGSMTPVHTPCDEDYALPPSSFYQQNQKVASWSTSPTPPSSPTNMGQESDDPVLLTVEDEEHTFDANGIIPANTFAAGDTVTLYAQWEDTNSVHNVSSGVYEVVLQPGHALTITDLPAGSTYRVFEETEDGWTLYSQSNTAGIIGADTTSTAKFVNKYSPTTASVQLVGTKLMDNRGATAGAFSFELTENGKGGTTSVSNSAGGAIVFPRIDYTSADVGVHTYIIREVIPVNADNDTTTYDRHDETVVVQVQQDGANLTAVVTYDTDGIRFENRTNPGNLKLTKEVVGQTEMNKDDEFTFKIALYNENGMPLTDGVYLDYDRVGDEPDTSGIWSGVAATVENILLPEKAFADPALGAQLVKTGRVSGAEADLYDDGTVVLRAGQLTYHGSWDEITENDIVKLEIDGDVAAQSGREVFYNCKNMISADLTGLDTSAVTDMYDMFYNCSSLTALDISDWDTSKVTNFRSMFDSCSKLVELKQNLNTSSAIYLGGAPSNVGNRGAFSNCYALSALDVSGFDTSKVQDMGSLFAGCRSLTVLDVGGFDTRAVTNMGRMFDGCAGLSYIDVRFFDTRNVRSMSGMFEDCVNLETLDVSGFDTRAVEGMSYMFSGCTKLAQLDVSGFDTSKVENMAAMFSNCKNLQRLDVSGFDTSSVTDMSAMFSHCSSLITIDVGAFDTRLVTSMYSMFSECTAATEIDVSGFDTGNVTDMEQMFMDCKRLSVIDVSGFNTAKVTAMSGMFYNCETVTEIDVSKWDTSNVVYMNNDFAGYGLFTSCSNLSELDLSNFDTGKVKDMSCMFSGCYNLVRLDIGNFDTSNVTTMRRMFASCNKLESVDVSGFDTSKVTDMQSMFSLCYALKSLDLSGWDTSAVTTTQYMFSRCRALSYVDFGAKSKFKNTEIPEHSASVNYSNKWIRADGAMDAKTAAQLFGTDYQESWAGAWIWEPVSSAITVLTFDANGGYISDDDRRVIRSSDAISASVPSDSVQRNNFILTGWNSKQDGSGTSYGVNGIIELEIGSKAVVYAQWELDTTVGYTVEYYQQDAENAEVYTRVSTQKVKRAGEVSTTVPAIIPQNMAGFITPARQSVELLDNNAAVVEYKYNRTHWSVSFDGNGADSGYMADQTGFVGGIPKTLDINKFSKAGYAFAGWRVSGVRGDLYLDGQQVVDLAGDGETVVLSAQWKEAVPLSPSSTGEYEVTLKGGESVTIEGLPAGTSYMVTETQIPAGWVCSTSPMPSGNITSSSTSEVVVENTYTPSGSVRLNAYKSFEGQVLQAGEFSFELVDLGDNVKSTATNAELDMNETIEVEDGEPIPNPHYNQGMVVFDEISFDAPGKYRYKIREISGEDSSIEYDDTVDIVDVFVSDMGKGVLSSSIVPVRGDTVFENRLKTSKLALSKALSNNTGSDQQFSFEIAMRDKNGNDILPESYDVGISDAPSLAPVAGKGMTSASQNATGAHKVVFDANGGYYSDNNAQENVVSVLAYFEERTAYAHTANINDEGIASRVYDNGLEENIIVQIPRAESINIELWYATESASYDWLSIYPAGITPSKTNYGEASISKMLSSSGKLAGRGSYSGYTRPSDDDSTYHRMIEDVPGDTAQFFFRSDGIGAYYGYYAIVTAEVLAHTVSGDATLVPNAPTMNAEFAGWYTDPECTDGNEFVFDNYIPSENEDSSEITVYAKYVDKTPVHTQTTVEDGKAVVTLRGNQIATIEGLPYGATYSITERDTPGWTMISPEGENGTLGDEVAQATFTNEYTAYGTWTPSLTKRLEGGTLDEGQFEFVMENDLGEQIEKVSNKADGSVSFAERMFDETDIGKTYTYRIREVSGNDDNIVYDPHTCIFSVTPVDAGAGHLSFDVTTSSEGNKPGILGLPIQSDDTMVNTMKLLFPMTGGPPIYVVIGAAGVAALLAGIALALLRRKDDGVETMVKAQLKDYPRRNSP